MKPIHFIDAHSAGHDVPAPVLVDAETGRTQCLVPNVANKPSEELMIIDHKTGSNPDVESNYQVHLYGQLMKIESVNYLHGDREFRVTFETRDRPMSPFGKKKHRRGWCPL